MQNINNKQQLNPPGLIMQKTLNLNIINLINRIKESSQRRCHLYFENSNHFSLLIFSIPLGQITMK